MKFVLDDAKLDALLAPHDSSRRPGVALGIAHHGIPVYSRWLGLADAGLPMALAPGIRMRIGSTSKHFTCLCIMLLAEDGKLTPGDSLRRHLPDLKPWADGVTLAQVMSHTGGVRCSLDLLTLTDNIIGTPLPHAAQVDLLHRVETTSFAPGSDWMYSNGGYVLLTEIVRRLSGMSFEAFLQERILKPAGLFESFARPLDTDIVPYTASLHMREADGSYRRGLFGPEIGGEGNIMSTVGDMLRWLRHLNAPQVGSAETWRAMCEPVLLTGGGSTCYGFGLVNSRYRGLPVLYHTGGVIGGTCQMLKARSLGLDIIAMTNSYDALAAKIVNQILDACVEGLDTAPQSVPGPFKTGNFLNPDTGRFLRLVEKEGGPAADMGLAQIPLIRRADGSAWILSNFADGMTLREDAAGITVEEYGRVEHLHPLPDAPADANHAIIGSWDARELTARARVEAGEPATLTITGNHGSARYTLLPQAEGIWAVIGDAGPAGQIEHRDGALLLSSVSTRRLRFDRAA